MENCLTLVIWFKFLQWDLHSMLPHKTVEGHSNVLITVTELCTLHYLSQLFTYLLWLYDYIYLTFPTAAAELFPESSWCSKLMSALHIIDRTAPYQMKWWYSSYRTSSKGYASILYSHILTLLVIYTIYSPTEMGKQNYFLYLDRANG